MLIVIGAGAGFLRYEKFLLYVIVSFLSMNILKMLKNVPKIIYILESNVKGWGSSMDSHSTASFFNWENIFF